MQPAKIRHIRIALENFSKIVDKKLVKKYNFFILEVVKAHIAKRPKYPKILHYRGEGIFFTGVNVINKAKQFIKFKSDENF